MEPLTALQALSTALTIYEKGAKVIRDLVGNLPESPVKETTTKELAKAEESMEIAKAQMADSLGFPLCHIHFPPGIMLKIRVGVFSCSKCGDTIGNSGLHQISANEDEFSA